MTSNGIVRWQISIETVSNTFNAGVSNIVSNSVGILFFMSSWANITYSTGKVCRRINGQTNEPIQECFQNDQLFADRGNILTINPNSTLLFTTVSHQSLGLINITDLQIIWINQENLGSDLHSIYNCDSMGIYWIGMNDHLNQINYQDQILFNEIIHSNGNRVYAFHKQKKLILQMWTNQTSTPSFNYLSAWDVNSKQDIHLRWEWKQPYINLNQYTQPLVGNDLIYLTWLLSIYPISVPLQIYAMQQLNPTYSQRIF